MPDLMHYKKLITARLSELEQRMHDVEHDLAEPKPADLEEQAVDIEDDEVLEGLGLAAQREVSLLNLALRRIEQGTYGICQKCEEPISDARLHAVLFAPLCRECVKSA